MKKIKITNDKITSLLTAESPSFPKYATQIINLANQNAGGTKPKIVGQMSDLIQQFEGNEFKKWEEWYLAQHPNAIQKATEKIVEMVENLKDVMTKIDQEMIEMWVRDLVIVKTFVGLKFQEAILKAVADDLKTNYRLAEPEEESKGIDGFVGSQAVSIKPQSYEAKNALSEQILVPIIFYEKMKDGINVYFEDSLLTSQ
ncbi:MjaI family restriction endonuclease [Thermoflexibacter ruber]|uniref:MjaI restriction endonuclease n=1 Tax=Thermoflexibacter ruber TaxID=1003 RepID=A0A1I2K080_9BACT|nr:MjaI family restriction endonuclease [Thermoflexibacter ruber]SFF58617.1 MjaI restriction endonuclease [Thermoflexibacter ruber]